MLTLDRCAITHCLTVTALLLALMGCQTNSAPIAERSQPPSERISFHSVSKGETLYSIAWRYDLDFRQLAAANSIGPPYAIFPGQRLNLDVSRVVIPPQADRVTAVAAIPRSKTTASKPAGRPSSPTPTPTPTPALKPAPTSAATTQQQQMAKIAQQASNQAWMWPITGRTVKSFNPAAYSKGIEIKGQSNQQVRAAKDGQVVYAGDGLRDYGRLVIVKHSQTFLSAYGHNSRLLVKEGDVVRQGQAIAELGGNGILYFEIRDRGKPQNPLNYLGK